MCIPGGLGLYMHEVCLYLEQDCVVFVDGKVSDVCVCVCVCVYVQVGY